MRATPWVVTALVLSGSLGSARAERWIGPSSLSGTVERPALYTQSVQHLARDEFNFSEFSPGDRVDLVSQGRMSLVVQPISLWITARSGQVAGANPSSAPIALLIPQHATEPSRLTFRLTEPVISVGFVLMNLTCRADLEVLGAGDTVLHNYDLPAGPAGARRWVAMMEDDRDIWKVRITPASPTAYAIDDLELGVHAPEPSMLFLLAATIALLILRKGRMRGKAAWFTQNHG